MHCESLETRRMFAFAVAGFGSTLYLTGTSGNDELNVWGGGLIAIDLDGDYTEDVWYYSSDVTNIEVEGDDGNDDITGGKGVDLLSGFIGDDVLEGGADGDVLFGDAGFDTATYRNATAAIVASLADSTVNTGEAKGDSYDEIEGLEGGKFADTLTGSGGQSPG